MRQRLTPFALVSLLSLACGDGSAATASSAPSGSGPLGSGAPSGSAASKEEPPLTPWIGIPRSSQVEELLKKQVYNGPTGTLRGRITIVGDPPPEDAPVKAKPDCAEAAATYQRLFRVGQDHAAADVMVAVTGYDGYVPPAEPVVKAVARGCAFDRRTYALAFGQRLEVVNDDKKGSYTPILDGAEYRAVMLAVPYGDPVKLYPTRPAINYVLRDLQDRSFMVADVLVLKFSTVAVTGLDGRYEIPRIPVGKVNVNALLPAIGKSLGKEGREIEIKEGDNTLDLELSYDAKVDKPVPRPPSPFARGTNDVPARKEGEFGGPPPADTPR